MTIPEITPGVGGSHDRRGQTSLLYVEEAAKLGADIDLPEVRRARKHLAHAVEIAAAGLRQDPQQAIADAAAAFHDGALDVDGVLAVAAKLEEGPAATAAKILARAEATADAAAFNELAKPGDRWISVTLRPLVSHLLEPLEELAAIIPPTIRRAGDIDSWATANQKWNERRTVRDAFTRLVDLVHDVTAVHDVADQMRQAQMIPVRQRRYSEDFRWLRLDRLQGRPGEDPEWFVINGFRRGAQPGIYTEREVTGEQAA